MLHPHRASLFPPLSRRALLTRVIPAGVVALAAGCSPVSTASASADGSGISSGGALDRPALLPYASLAAGLGAAADGFAGLAATPGTPGTTAVWASTAATMSRAQARLLQRSDPLSGTPIPPAAAATHSGSPGSASASPSVPPSLPTIAAREADLETQTRAACLAATSGDLALLFASLSVTAHAVRGPSVPVAATTLVPTHCDVGDRTAALAVLRTRLDALIQGLEQGLGALPFHDPAYSPGLARLTAVEGVREAVDKELLAASGPPTPGPLVYAMPGTTDSPTHVATLWGLLERDVMAAWLRVAAASSGADRGSALDAAVGQQDHVAAQGVGITWWPGWV